jgi:predicted metal-dependent hydrolase
MEQHFTYENVSFDYQLILEDRKTIAATVYPNESISVKAPLESELSRINEFLTRKFRWVLKQRRFFNQFKDQKEKEYVSGEAFRYLGRRYKLLVRATTAPERVCLHHGTLVVYSSAPGDGTRTQGLLEHWYAERATKIFNERLKECFGLFEYETCPRIVIRKLNKRWGSYLPKGNRIHLNPELVQASKAQIDYVIIHELCHVAHNNHSRAFYELLSVKLPKWQDVKAELELKLLA